MRGLPITKLQLSGYRLPGHKLDLGPLAGLPIADLYLVFIKTPNASIEVLETLPLAKLCLARCDRLRDSGLARLQRLPLLTSLTVENCYDLSKAGIASLEEGATPLKVPTTQFGRFVSLIRDSLFSLSLWIENVLLEKSWVCGLLFLFLGFCFMAWVEKLKNL